MFFSLFEHTLQSSLPSYWREGSGVKCGTKMVPSYVMNIDDFHRALFAIANEGTKARIALPNHANIITEYEIEQTPLFSMKTLKKYKNELYSFKGVSLSNSDDRIGIIWCFNILKVYFIDHYQTLEPVTRFGEYFIFYKEKYVITRRLKEEKQSDIIEDLHIDSIINAESIPKDIFTPINNPKISHIAEYMSSVKIIRFLPFPTCTTIQKMLVGRAVPTGGFSDEEKKKIIFVEMAASVHYINLIFLPEVSIRFEMVFDLNIVLLENTIENIKKYAYNPNKIGQFSKDASFVNQYIDDKDIDLAHLVHSGVNEGSTNLKMLKPFHRDKYTGITTDDFMIFGYFEHIFCHEISHQLGAPHTWTYTNNIYPTGVESGSGITIMGYSGRCGVSNVESGKQPFFSWISIERIQQWVSCQYHLNDEYKANRPPVIADMKRYFVIPKGTAFLLTGSCCNRSRWR